MPWMKFKGKDGEEVVAHVSMARKPRRRCRWCSEWSTRLCDGENLKRKSKTCDAPMCANHGIQAGATITNGVPDTRDLCPDCCLKEIRDLRPR